jgi:hypothetical protein
MTGINHYSARQIIIELLYYILVPLSAAVYGRMNAGFRVYKVNCWHFNFYVVCFLWMLAPVLVCLDVYFNVSFHAMAARIYSVCISAISPFSFYMHFRDRSKLTLLDSTTV